ncbi:hypothetical protein JKF63_00078 [Porcisia hertigi]|uniref:C3H1-type domain-containing protein n=1 Tax=Porcisia hertigi TaxID=2761500 RepID=A0A836HSZ2_9TRYP|nr:hypothetical protein JKF63_00078 [Porcisia hertigi]
MVYNIYGPLANSGHDTHMYSTYAPLNAYGQGQGGSSMMYDCALTGGQSTGHPYGYHADPSVGATYEYTPGNNMHSNGSVYRGYGSRSGGTNGCGRGGDANGVRNPQGYDQQATFDYEVHDNQLKAPVVVTPATVVATLGSMRFFSRAPKPIVYGSRSVVRICDAFQEGRCASSERCHDIHVNPEYLAQTRSEMGSWLSDRENEFRKTLETDAEKTFSIFVADLKEVVEVPITSLVFTKGLYVDPTTRAKRARSAGNHAHVHAVMQVPTSCGLYSSDPHQCKWERWCNQVHIDHRWMKAKKAEFDEWFIELQNRYFSLSPDETFTVHDPKLKCSTVLPKFSIAGFSRGLFQGSMKKLASVCLLYQRGKCTAGSCCNQIHVSPQYLNLVRECALLEQSPDALPQEKQRLRHEMELLRAPLIEKQLQEQRKAVQAMASKPAPCPEVVSLPSQETHNNTVDVQATAEDDFNCSGPLFEHVQVDEDVEPVSRTISANTSLSRRLNASALDINLLAARHVNSDGSYSFNPYGSLTSLPEGSMSHGRFPGTRGSGQPMDGNSTTQFTPGNVQFLSTGTKGTRRVVALVSPELGNSMTEGHRNEEDVEGGGGHPGDGGLRSSAPDAATQLTAMNCSNSGYRAKTHLTVPEGGRRCDGVAQGEQSSSLQPLDFDASLHFTPYPLLGFDASTTSTHRNGSIREEDNFMHAQTRQAASSSSYPFPGSSTTSQQNLLFTPMQRGIPGNATAAAKVRLAASAAPSRPLAHRPAPSLSDAFTTNTGVGSSISATKPAFLGEQPTGTD